MSFTLDQQFLEKLHERLLKTGKTFLASTFTSDEIPSIENLEKIISTVFWASIKKEEGRSLDFGVTFADICPIEHLALTFNIPREVSVDEIKKLASAIPSPNGNIGIWTFNSWGLCIWGILNTSLSGITINVIDPGRLSISYPLSFKIAVISGKKSGFINSEWNREALNLMAVDKNIASSTDEIISFLYGSFTQEILRQLRSLKSGGTLIFIPENAKWEKTLEKPISYKSLKPFNGIRHIENALESELKAISTGTLLVVDRGMELIGSYQYKAFITEAARSIAHMASIDGGTVLRKNFDVLAFGAKVDITQKRRKTEEVVIISPFEDEIDVERPLNYAFRGKRHLSAARYVIKNPGSVAFVVSQDGGVTGFKVDDQIGSKTEHKLLAYKELEILM